MKGKEKDKDKKKKSRQGSSVRIEFKGDREMVTVLYNYPGIGALKLSEGENDLEALANDRKLKLKVPKVPKEKMGEKKKGKKQKEQGLLPMGDGFKVLLTVAEGFSLKGTKVNVFSEDVLIGQGQLNNDGAIVFPSIKVPLAKPLRVIVRFPEEQYLEDLDFFVDEGDTALVAQI